MVQIHCFLKYCVKEAEASGSHISSGQPNITRKWKSCSTDTLCLRNIYFLLKNSGYFKLIKKLYMLLPNLRIVTTFINDNDIR